MPVMGIQLEAVTQPGGAAPPLTFLQSGWCEEIGDETAPKLDLAVLLTAERGRWPRVPSLEEVAKDCPILRVRRGGAVVEITMPLLLAVSRAVQPLVVKAAARAKAPHDASWQSVVAGIDAFCMGIEDGTMTWSELGARWQRQGAAFAQRLAQRLPPQPTEMNAVEFWERVASLRARDTVPRRPFRDATDEQLRGFFGRLSRVLWELDTPTVAKAVYGDLSYVSVDDFLDARCAIALRGPAAAAAAKLGLVPSKDERAEWLVEACHGEAEERGLELASAVGMETGSNPAWRETRRS